MMKNLETFLVRQWWVRAGRRAGMILMLFMVVGAAWLPAHGKPIRQRPLTITQPVPPNVFLMLDDSGSMDFPFMPDLCYLDGTRCHERAKGYYWIDHVDNDALISASNNGVYYDPAITYKPPVDSEGKPYDVSGMSLTDVPVSGFEGGRTVDLTRGYTEPLQAGYAQSGYNIDYSHVTGSYYNRHYYFQYSIPVSHGYKVHYVAVNCGSVSNCVNANDTSGKAAPKGVKAGKNIAIWFAFYHTRMLMTKTALMLALNDVAKDTRFGFGSINGQNNSRLPNAKVYQDGLQLAKVAPFGDGTKGTQKKKFWRWLKSLSPSGGTPLRKALQAVGNYYSSAAPWKNTKVSDHPLTCRQAYTVLATDGFWNSDSVYVGNADGVSGDEITGPNGRKGQYTAKPPFSDNYSNTLADVAMHYWKKDLRPNIKNKVPTNSKDSAFWQHMTTFTIGLGFEPEGINATPEEIFNWAQGGKAISNFTWPEPDGSGNGIIYNITDVLHAAVNGHGGYFSATDPESFIKGLKDTLNQIGTRTGTGASLAFNGQDLQHNAVTYQSFYHSTQWTGGLKAFPIDSSGQINDADVIWSAEDVLPDWDKRNIKTYDRQSHKLIDFKWDTLTPGLRDALGKTKANQKTMVAYLRGDTENEERNGGNYRTRKALLGDMVHSVPAYVGAVDKNLFTGAQFAGMSQFKAFAHNHQNRRAQIYIAANDGMLHAFDAATGKETFAFIPSTVITHGASDGTNLTALSDTDYGNDKHQYFNDGKLTVSEVYMGSWKTVLVGSTGRGPAKTVYALDVTDPDNIRFLWQRSAYDGQGNSDYIGQMTSKPVVAQTADGQWSVLMSGGYDNAHGNAALLQFSLNNGDLAVYKTDKATDNGLAPPAVWIPDPANNIATVAYAGDLKGRVWQFDLQTGSVSQVFTAAVKGGKTQPITAGMALRQDGQDGDLWIFFGTGQYLYKDDIKNKDMQTWYGLRVRSDNLNVVSTSSTRTALAPRFIKAETTIDDHGRTRNARVFSSADEAPSLDNKAGWYIDLVFPSSTGQVTGERMVIPNQFFGGLVYGTTRTPNSTDICDVMGSGWLMALDPFTGTNPDEGFLDLNGGTGTVKVNGKDYAIAGVGLAAMPNASIFVGNSIQTSLETGTFSGISLLDGGNQNCPDCTNPGDGNHAYKRISWREITNP